MELNNQAIKLKKRTRIIFLCALFLFSIAIGLMTISSWTETPPQENSQSYKETIVRSKHGRMVIILLDSLQKKYLFSKHMPFLLEQRKRGSWGTSVVASIPLSIAGTKAIFSGVLSGPFSIIEDFQSSASANDNLVKRVAQTNREVIIIEGLSSSLYGSYSGVKAINDTDHFLFGQYLERSDRTFDGAIKALKKENWDLAIITCYSIDHVGHLATPRSDEYRRMLRDIDNRVKEIVRLTDDNDTVLITSEHGMDDHGFHMDQSADVMETGFIIWGPRIRKGGEQRILQIDWAPTLSILAGVSPYYNSLALPDFGLLKLSAGEQLGLLKGFSQHLLPNISSQLSFNDLQKKRMALMRKTGSPLVAIIVTLVIMISSALLAYVASADIEFGRNSGKMILYVFGGIIIHFSATGAFFYSKTIPKIFSSIPFSANFIFSHPFQVLIFLIFITILPLWYTRRFQLKNEGIGKLLTLFLFSFALAFTFLSVTPYYPLGWIIWSLPLVAFGITRRNAWLVCFGALWVGLAIRRLTYVGAYYNIELPDRWILVLAVTLVCSFYLWWKCREDTEKWQLFGVPFLLFGLGAAITGLETAVEVRDFLLVLLLVPVAMFSWKRPNERGLWLALWVACFYLGTSSRVDHITHIVSIPLLMAVWAATERSVAMIRGMAFSLVVWALYLLPGNGFDLNLRELHDKYIMSSVSVENIEFTVMVVFSRYLLPASVLLVGMNWKESGRSLSSIAATALLPAFCGIAIILSAMIWKQTVGYPWAELEKITVLFGYCAIVVCAVVGAKAIQGIARL